MKSAELQDLQSHVLLPMDIPCTVAFAPAAAKSPILPTMKYWKVLFVVSPFLLIYAPKLGIFVVGFLSMSRKGDWKVGVRSYSPAARSTMSALCRRWEVHVSGAGRAERQR